MTQLLVIRPSASRDHPLEAGPDGMQRLLRSIYVDVPALRPGTVGAYALAFASAAVATALRLFIDQYVEVAPFVTHYPAIVFTTVISGFGAGLVASC